LQQLKGPKKKQLQATKLSVEGRGMLKYLWYCRFLESIGKNEHYIRKITCIFIAWGMGWSLAGSNRPTSEGSSGSCASIGDIVRENVSPFQLDIGFPIGLISVKLSLPRIDVLEA
jgi:hypothetical protein